MIHGASYFRGIQDYWERGALGAGADRLHEVQAVHVRHIIVHDGQGEGLVSALGFFECLQGCRTMMGFDEPGSKMAEVFTDDQPVGIVVVHDENTTALNGKGRNRFWGQSRGSG